MFWTVGHTQWLRKGRIPVVSTKSQLQTWGHAASRVPSSISGRQSPAGPSGTWRAAHGLQPGQHDLAFAVQVTMGAHVEPLHQQLLVEQRVVGSQCAGGVMVGLVVVTQVCLPHWWDVFIHVHLATQVHHQQDAWWGGGSRAVSNSGRGRHQSSRVADSTVVSSLSTCLSVLTMYLVRVSFPPDSRGFEGEGWVTYPSSCH